MYTYTATFDLNFNVSWDIGMCNVLHPVVNADSMIILQAKLQAFLGNVIIL